MDKPTDLSNRLRNYFFSVRRKFDRKLRARFGYRVPVIRGLYLKKSNFGLRGIDKKIRDFVGTARGFYVELGANDGVSQSNTLDLEWHHGWRGILIEPVQENFEKLLINRSSGRNKLFRAACVSSDFKGDSLTMVTSGLMSTAIGLDSDVEDPIHHAAGNQMPMFQTVPARTLTSVLDENGAPAVMQLLSIDVEGAELEVFKGLDLERYRFEWIVAESRSIPRLQGYLAPYGYSLEKQLTEHDFLFRGPGEPDAD